MIKYLFNLTLIISLSGFAQQKGALSEIIQSEDPKLSRVIQNVEDHELQIIYSKVIRNNGKVSFDDFQYGVDAKDYFYPASTVKLPIAVLSLEKINELNEKGFKIDRNTSYRLENDSLDHTIAGDINAIFAVSDNDAYNRLFEFLGQDYINSKLRSKGLKPVRISHRFSGEGSGDTLTRQMVFKLQQGDFKLPVTNNAKADSLELSKVIKGVGYIKNGEQVDEPFSFAFKNYFPLETQHNLMKRLYFPQLYPENEVFQLTKEDLNFLKAAMSRLPREMDYDESEYYDSYGKFFLYGDSKDRMPSHVKIYNKVGYAYGTLTETAYIQDEKNDVDFLLSASLLVNENGIFNDGVYEYEDLGIPFLAELGRQIYQMELQRKN
ncbi:class A beta-lactamase-related serine hydrolase [Gramella lutea]|uniref:Class A beta-lactamase-related serine hydrolase n=1 Tax=Christiangramia lutea TaxID=1607951 RepID=A0A9X1V5H1_9FLAO|nr:serine hydrolase [Christiangramia lutea]MCH4824046.1 class A beta-lactamase-related serine hydrolase [Christiangramia lutea]